MLHPLRRLLITGLLLSVSVAAQAAPPPAGTLISNTAGGSFTDQASGVSVSLRSNTVNATVVTSSTAQLAIVLAASTSASTPGATFNLTASAANGGGAAANPVAVTVNGASASLFLLSLQIPANTRFASAQPLSAGAQLLYHVLGSAANTYVTAVAAGATVDQVAWSLPALPPGTTLAGQLSVTVNVNASGSLTAAASSAWASAPQGSVQSTPSNTVVVQLPARAASIAYFTGASYVTTSVSGLTGSPLFVQVDAASCNTDPTRVLSAPVTLTSRLTGDVEILTAVETAPNTGLFRIQPNVPTANAASLVASSDGILEVLPNDLVTATVSRCGAVTVSATTTLRIDPGGLLIDKTAGRITAQVGDFVDYTIRLNNTSGTALANTLVNDRLPAGFAYVNGTARLNGTPLTDPAGSGPALRFSLGVLATGAQATLSYRVRVGVGAQGTTGVNTAQAVSGGVLSNSASAAVQVIGGVFAPEAYLIGKVYADCNANGVQDPGEPGVPGVRIYLEDGTYAVSDEEGKYSLYGLIPRLHVAKADLTTLPAGARLEVLNTRNALDAGSVFVDLTEGELHKADFALSACSPSLREQIAARRRALTHPSEIALAAGSLWPASAATAAVDARTLPSSGVIRLPGQSQGAGGAAPAAPQVAMASAMPGIAPFASAGALGAVGDPGGPYAPQAQGVPQPLNTPSEKLSQEQSAPAPATAADESDFADFKALRRTLQAEPLEKLLPRMDPQVGFVGLSDGEVLPINQTTVRVKGPLGARLELAVNGQRIAETQVGKKSSLQDTGVLAWEYIGVDLRPGRNALSVRALDDFGIVRGSAHITVLAPGPLERIVIDAPTRVVADAATPVPITVLLRDADGLPVAARTPITLSSSLGQWQLPGEAAGSLQASPEQRFVTGGVAHLLLLPPAQPGEAQLSVSSGAVKTTTTLEFTPQLRPMLAVGLISGTLNLRNLNPSALQPAQSADVFEREIESVSRSFDGGKDAVAARSALFLKGKVLGSTLLTLAYDSDKPSDITLFRDIQPDQFYPVYGDSSARGFDAQSTGKLYVMVQNGTNYALLGDYATQSDNPARQLTQYARALNGAKGHWQLGTVAVDGFASETSTTQSVVEFRANGTSGPFQLDLRGVANSQQVDLITRDRNQPAIILNDTPLTPFTDYAIEPYTGLLLLKNPVASIDASLNPVYVRVSYSVDAGGPKHWVEGADARLPLSRGFTLGATAIHDADPTNELTLQGVNLTGKLGEHTTGTAEVARSNTDLQGAGTGERVDIRQDGTTLQAHLWGVRTQADFYNPNSLQSAGESQYGAKATYRLDERDSLVAESLKTSNSTTGAQQTGAELKVEHSLPGNAKLEVGLRHNRANAESVLSAPALPGTSTPIVPAGAAAPGASAQVGYTSARMRLTVPVPGVKGAEIFGLAEEAIDGSGGREDALGGTYAVNATTRIYAQHDFINSLNGPYTLNPSVSQYSTVAGISSALPDTTQLFNEYRVAGGVDGRSSEAATGLRRLWKLSDGIGLSASVQRIAPLSGTVTDESNAISLGADYTAARDWKASAQAQWQTSANSHSWLFTAGMARKLDADWTLLERALYSRQSELAAGGGRELARLQSGFAYRPVDSNVWNALGQVEYKRDFDTTLGPGLSLDERAWILAGNLNVQPSRGWQISGRYAAKRAIDRSDSLASHSFTQLAGARSIWDVSARWDAGVQGYRTWGAGAAQYAVGVELGYLVWKGLRLSLGCNAKGFEAPDLAGEAYTQRGVYLHLSFKFDESLFGGTPLAARAPPLRGIAGRQP